MTRMDTDEDKPLGWEAPPFQVQTGATYREKVSGRLLQLAAVDCRSNSLYLVPAGPGENLTSQQLAERFELAAKYGEEVPASTLITFNPADPEAIWILSLMAFHCAPYAHLLRDLGAAIPRKVEAEQAAVMVWLLQKLQEHGKDWREKADEEIAEMRAKAKAMKNEESLKNFNHGTHGTHGNE
ncbi:MAG: hypothetical protein EOP85_11970 [Verrucomicrobiaceae bacterium]|nr:MAG: hypothetical protein EOP85_11970 [Verrucomicrobiaceae bacterium]